MKNFIWITTSFEGFHKYPDAPDDVTFLKNKHRHIFHVRVWIEVSHNNRDIEFILFKRFIETLLSTANLNNKSCEMVSDELYEEIRMKYPDREVRIEISEDCENGSLKEYKK